MITKSARSFLKPIVWRILEGCGYDTRDWARVVMYEQCERLLSSSGIDRSRATVLGISSSRHFENLGFAKFRATTYPQFDICRDVLPERYDLIIADQVFEHVEDPEQAARNVNEMLSPGGWFLVTTPFMLGIHLHPVDCSRWTELGMKNMLGRAGFRKESIETGQWGNRRYIRAHMRSLPGWPRRGFGSLRNESNFPVVVWAFARKDAN
jgi:SAM-dependent methyltransferase